MHERNQCEPPDTFVAYINDTGKMILLTDIIFFKNGNLFRDHNWLQKSARFLKLIKKMNEHRNKQKWKISFTAIVADYKHNGKKFDISLNLVAQK